jgi:predicted acylesterase/phospholipase RssA
VGDTGDILVDGGTYNNLPMNVFRESEDFTLGIRLMSDVDQMGRKEIKSLKNFASELVGNLSELACSKFITVSDERRIVDIPTGSVKSTDFGLDKTKKQWLIDSGQTSMTTFIEKRDTK